MTKLIVVSISIELYCIVLSSYSELIVAYGHDIVMSEIHLALKPASVRDSDLH